MFRFFITTCAVLVPIGGGNSFFLRSKGTQPAVELDQQQEPHEEHPLLRELGLAELDLFNEDPSLYMTTDCPKKHA